MLSEPILSRILQSLNRRHMRLDEIPDRSFFPAAPREPCQLYLHVPFCEHLCPFCSFHREKLAVPKAVAYFHALRKEIDSYHDRGFRFHTVYVGGGTPTVLPEELAETIEHVRKRSPVKQVSVETNPDHINPRVLRWLKEARVNRLSVGVQSFDDALLSNMHRLERYGNGARMVQRLREVAGEFETVNADFIFNLPLQTTASLAHDIHIVKNEIGLDQVSFYPLMTAGTTNRSIEQNLGNVTHDKEESFYYQIVDELRGTYTPSSVWNFCRGSGLIDEYIVADLDYVGIGSGAFGHVGEIMLANTFSIDDYTAIAARGGSPLAGWKRLSAAEQMRYHILMQLFGLRLDRDRLDRQYGDFAREAWKELFILKMYGAIEEDGSTLRLTRRGMYLWVVLMRQFFVGVNLFREQMIARTRAATTHPP